MARNLLGLVRLLILAMTSFSNINITVTYVAAAAESYDAICRGRSSSSSTSNATINGDYREYDYACNTGVLPGANEGELQGLQESVLNSIKNQFKTAFSTYDVSSYCTQGEYANGQGSFILFSYASCGEGNSIDQCDDCLQGASEGIVIYCEGTAGVRAWWSATCCLRYERYSFC